MSTRSAIHVICVIGVEGGHGQTGPKISSRVMRMSRVPPVNCVELLGRYSNWQTGLTLSGSAAAYPRVNETGVVACEYCFGTVICSAARGQMSIPERLRARGVAPVMR